MRHVIKALIIFILIYSGNKLKSQNQLKIGFTESMLFVDYFGDSAKYPPMHYKGWLLQTGVGLDYKIVTKTRFNPVFGIAGSYMWTGGMDFGFDFTYLHAKIGLDYQTNKEWLNLTGIFTNNFLISKEWKNNFRVSRAQRIYFLNLDLGGRMKLSKHVEISLTSPITITPMAYDGEFLSFGIPGAERYYIWAETLGLNVGIHYVF